MRHGRPESLRRRSKRENVLASTGRTTRRQIARTSVFWAIFYEASRTVYSQHKIFGSSALSKKIAETRHWKDLSQSLNKRQYSLFMFAVSKICRWIHKKRNCVFLVDDKIVFLSTTRTCLHLSTNAKFEVKLLSVYPAATGSLTGLGWAKVAKTEPRTIRYATPDTKWDGRFGCPSQRYLAYNLAVAFYLRKADQSHSEEE